MKVYNSNKLTYMTNLLYEKLQEERKLKNFNEENYVKNKAELLNLYMSKYNLKSCIVAISGGIDSAVVLSIVNYASKINNSPIKKIVPLLLPIKESIGVTHQTEATNKGVLLCQKLNLKPYIIDLSEINQLIINKTKDIINIEPNPWAIGQLGPYTRTPMLCYVSTLMNVAGYPAITVGTTNRSEFGYIGYVGKFSDEAVDVQLISDIYKSEVFKVANFLNVPKEIIESIPDGDMYDERTDEDVFGISYDYLELYMHYLNKKEEEQTLFLLSLDNESKELFLKAKENADNLHKYNKHKYISKSPAIHLDLWNSSIKGGLDNYYDNNKKYGF